MFIEEGFKGYHEGWRYVLGILIIFVAWQFIGAIPLMAALIYKVLGTGDFPSDISGMAELLGSNLFLFLMLFTFAVGLVSVILTAKYLHRQSFTSLTTARSAEDFFNEFCNSRDTGAPPTMILLIRSIFLTELCN